MTLDRRFVVMLVVTLLAVAVLVAAFRDPLASRGRNDGGPGGACPPGHVTSNGCSKP